jgi:hypothetical protein
MLAARNWVFCAPLRVGNSDRLVRSAVDRRVARPLNVAGPCAGLPTLLNGPVRIANWLACPLRLRARASMIARVGLAYFRAVDSHVPRSTGPFGAIGCN